MSKLHQRRSHRRLHTEGASRRPDEAGFREQEPPCRNGEPVPPSQTEAERPAQGRTDGIVQRMLDRHNSTVAGPLRQGVVLANDHAPPRGGATFDRAGD